MLAPGVDNNYISNVHVIFVSMCVLIVRYHMMFRGLKNRLNYKAEVLNVRLLNTFFSDNKISNMQCLVLILSLNMLSFNGILLISKYRGLIVQ